MFQRGEVVGIQHKPINKLGRSNNPKNEGSRCNPGIENRILRLEVYAGGEGKIENGEALADASHC